MTFPEGPNVVLLGTVKPGQSRSLPDSGSEVLLIGINEDEEAENVLYDWNLVGGGEHSLDCFTDIRLIYPGDPNLDRILVLNDLLERRTPFANGQKVTLDLAKDILGLIDTMHLPVPTTPQEEHVTRVVQGLYKKRDVLDGVATQLAPFMLGPWTFDYENVAWSRHPLLPPAWVEFQVCVHRRTRLIDDNTTTPIDWWVRYQSIGEDEVFIKGSLPISTDIDPLVTFEAAKASVDTRIRFEGFILLG